jgi:hypothetical protein
VKAQELWESSLGVYMNNSPGIARVSAYEKLGHVLHLVTQDMAQPQHVHDDPHTYVFLGGDESSIEALGKN